MNESNNSGQEPIKFSKKLLNRLGYKNNLHFVIEWFLIALVLVTVYYSITWDIPETKKANVCYQYYLSLDPTSDMYKLYSKHINNANLFNVSGTTTNLSLPIINITNNNTYCECPCNCSTPH